MYVSGFFSVSKISTFEMSQDFLEKVSESSETQNSSSLQRAALMVAHWHHLSGGGRG